MPKKAAKTANDNVARIQLILSQEPKTTGDDTSEVLGLVYRVRIKLLLLSTNFFGTELMFNVFLYSR